MILSFILGVIVGVVGLAVVVIHQQKKLIMDCSKED